MRCARNRQGVIYDTGEGARWLSADLRLRGQIVETHYGERSSGPSGAVLPGLKG
jgi:hypothetical protein